MRNLITDVPGLAVGHATDLVLGSGVTAVLCDPPAVAAVDVRGGSPGTRETDLLDPAATVAHVDAIVLSGGSAFGLDAASGVMGWLAAHGRGHPVRDVRVPIVPAAILFDLLNGGDKAWGEEPPYRALGRAAAEAAGPEFALGSVGAGTGATTARVKGGLGSASAMSPSGHVVGALVAVNALGCPLMGNGPHFRAAPFERDGEFGGLGLPSPLPADGAAIHLKGATPMTATTLAVVATDAVFSGAQARHFAVMAQDGLALSLFPVHTPLDGDCVFALATGTAQMADPVGDLLAIGATGAAVLARAVARAVHEATTLPHPGAQRAWRDQFPAAAAGR
ncbi:P1 family peptidase [Azorhizobium doebereinerae]|uniref:P1 family peptidase n=1 Tax=Azorhizobium doebereinerae TaxID=281091 RepID=UPI000402A6AC|nr:P1 family peptidase [Azorhizobium doebereinerae]